VICAIGAGPDEILARDRFPTTTPDETIGRAVAFFRGARVQPASIGIAAFGPLHLEPGSPAYGTVGTTPKPGWRGASVVTPFETGLGAPVTLDTDVGAAAVGEWRWGAARGSSVVAYLTVGTGIGVGIAIDGRPYHGLGHPEFGHIPIARDPADDLRGVCPVHGDCLEGLASGPAIAARWGRSGDTLPDDHPAWELEARYLGMALTTLVLTLAPGCIVMGGGVMRVGRIHALIRADVRARLAGYLDAEPFRGTLDDYLVPPGLGEDSGVLGAIALARHADGG
jgi:fructokinase